MSRPELPDFHSLPAVPGQPQGNTWGFWGKDDQLGTLNLLTPDAIQRAGREVIAGKHAALDLPLGHFSQRIGTRIAFEQKIIDYHESGGLYVHDDELRFNTQSSSQWDGLTHCAMQDGGWYYNGLKHEDVKGKGDGRNGTHKWVENGGIVGRGVLLDYARWREETKQAPAAPGTSHAITTTELESVAAHQNLTLHPGDILLLRTGFTAWHDKASASEIHDVLQAGTFIGLDRSQQSIEWLWNKHFAAVACDAPGFECCPVPFGVKGEVVLHEWILVHWGMPLGELWNLKSLARICGQEKRWSFLLTSAPLYVHGGVASPPNAVAIL